MPLVSFCNRVSLEHAPKLPASRHRTQQAAPTTSRPSLPKDGLDFLRSGVAWLSPRRPPPGRPLALVDLPQPDRSRHPLSLIRAVPRLETPRLGDPAVGISFRTDKPGRPSTLDQPWRAAARGLSRKRTTNSRTRGAFGRGAEPSLRSLAEPGASRLLDRLATTNASSTDPPLPPDQGRNDGQLGHPCSPVQPQGGTGEDDRSVLLGFCSRNSSLADRKSVV